MTLITLVDNIVFVLELQILINTYILEMCNILNITWENAKIMGMWGKYNMIAKLWLK